MRFLICILGLIFINQAEASTFVGNGGNAGDIELQITLGQIQKSLESIDRDKASNSDNNLCACASQFEGRPVCDILKQLSTEQARFCSRYVTMKAAELAQTLARKNELSFSWTHEQIEVHEEGSVRGADAVTDAKRMSMTLNQKRFLELNENERLFLVGHELFHLTSYQGKYLSDEGAIGPFSGADGGRKFINAMGAALVMQTNYYGIFRQYEAAERRSKSYKKTYVSIGYVSNSTPNDTTSAFDINKSTGGQIGLRYQLTNEWGLVGHYVRLRGEKTIMNTISAKEEKNILSAGVGYRWFPFSNPLTRWGQSHFILSGTADLLAGEYKYDEQGLGGTAKAASTGYTAACNYFIPFNSGLWAYAGASYSSLPYSYNLDNQVNLDYKDNGATFALGVTYGF